MTLASGFGRFSRRANKNGATPRAMRSLEKHFEVEEGEGWAVRLQGLDELLMVSRRQLSAVRELVSGHP